MFSITSDIISLFPLVGSIVEESLSYAATKYALNNILEEFFQISADLIDILNEYSYKDFSCSSVNINSSLIKEPQGDHLKYPPRGKDC